MRVYHLLAAILVPLLLQAELPPSAYEAMQAKAQDYVRIEPIRVDVGPGETPAQQKVRVVAIVTEVMRTTNGIKTDEIINIDYVVTEHPRGWAGPGEIPILFEKETVVAYLNKTEMGDFSPAAGIMSFSNF